jgi:hypothetical protein
MTSQRGRWNGCWLLGLALLCPGAARTDEAEDKAFAFVLKLGGQAIRNFNLPGRPVVRVVLFQTKVSDVGLKELAGLKNLKALYLSTTQVSDAGLKELAALKNLQVLYLSNTKETAAGVQELLKSLPKCQISR